MAKHRFQPGNTFGKRRPQGVKSHEIKEHRALLGPMVPEILAKCYAMALDGDIGAMKIILDRAMPIRSVVDEEFSEELAELRALLEERQTNEVSVQ